MSLIFWCTMCNTLKTFLLFCVALSIVHTLFVSLLFASMPCEPPEDFGDKAMYAFGILIRDGVAIQCNMLANAVTHPFGLTYTALSVCRNYTR